jgi:hypothetical protein
LGDLAQAPRIIRVNPETPGQRLGEQLAGHYETERREPLGQPRAWHRTGTLPGKPTAAADPVGASSSAGNQVIARVRAPQSRAQASVSTISSVWPDWESATASTPDRSRRLE